MLAPLGGGCRLDSGVTRSSEGSTVGITSRDCAPSRTRSIDVDALNDNIRFIAEAIASVEHRLMALVTEVHQLRAMVAAPTMAVPRIADRTIPIPPHIR